MSRQAPDWAAEPPDGSGVPTADELDGTDRLLDRLAAGGHGRSTDPATGVLRTAAAPGDEAELVGASAFSAAVAQSAAQRATIQPEPRRVTIWGRVIAVKVLVVAAIATVGIAGAGAATGVILHAVDQDPPAPERVDLVGPEHGDGPGGAADDAGDTTPGSASASMPLTQALDVVTWCRPDASAPDQASLESSARAAGVEPAELCTTAEAVVAESEDAAAHDQPTSTTPGDAPSEDGDGAAGEGSGVGNSNAGGNNPNASPNAGLGAGNGNGAAPGAGTPSSNGSGAGNANAGGNNPNASPGANNGNGKGSTAAGGNSAGGNTNAGGNSSAGANNSAARNNSAANAAAAPGSRGSSTGNGNSNGNSPAKAGDEHRADGSAHGADPTTPGSDRAGRRQVDPGAT